MSDFMLEEIIPLSVFTGVCLCVAIGGTLWTVRRVKKINHTEETKME